MATKRKSIVGNIAALPGRIVGEISKLRDNWTGRWAFKTGRWSKAYKLDSSRVDYRLARGLYNNELDEYKLGGAFAKPIINTVVGFMGVPRFRIEDEDAQEVLDQFFGANVSRMQQTHRDALRDGDCWVWITREEAPNRDLYPELGGGPRLVYNIIPPEQVAEVRSDPFTGEPVEYVLKSQHEWADEAGNRRRCVITQRISAERRAIEVDGDVPPGVEVGEFDNPWGFIPIVQFSNERDSSSAFGRSDLEAVEPFIKAYHDVMMHAIEGHKLHSTPKMKLQVKDVRRFLQNNFGINDPAEFARRGGTINLEGQELVVLEAEDEAGFIEVRSAIGSAEPLLKLLFMCIVDVSETPEFAFGTKVAASQASVREQMPVLIRRIARKREQFTESWQQLARIVLAMTAKAEGRRFSTHEVTLLWDEIDPRSGEEIANELYTIVQALARALEADLIGLESAVDFLARHVDTMSEFVGDNPEVPGERERIIKTKLLRMRLEDADLAEAEENLISQVLQAVDRDPRAQPRG